MNLGTATILRANARALPLPDDSVDLIVTSPPYFALRSYQDGGEHYDGQIGSEPTPAEFLDALIEVTRECVRVLKPSGSLFVNLGDKYAGGGGQWDKDERDDPGGRRSSKTSGGVRGVKSGGKTYGLRHKSLMGIPWRYALRCIDDLGLILRAEVIWSKPNGLPESVTDRVRRSHEQWFHFTREPRYFSAVDEIRERHVSEPGREGKGALGGQKSLRPVGPNSGAYNALGKLPGSVWTVPTEPLRVPDHLGIDHFAAFPTEWPKRLILGWSPGGVCTACGEGRRPATTTEYEPTQRTNGDDKWFGERPADEATRIRANGGRSKGSTTIDGYVCACPEPAAPTRPAVVLDPFGGTGTTALVAKALGRHGISVDLSADYCRLATWRTNNRDQLAKVLGIAKSDAPTQEEALF